MAAIQFCRSKLSYYFFVNLGIVILKIPCREHITKIINYLRIETVQFIDYINYVIIIRLTDKSNLTTSVFVFIILYHTKNDSKSKSVNLYFYFYTLLVKLPQDK